MSGMPTSQQVFGSVLNSIFNLYTVFVTRKFKKMGVGCSIRPILNTTHSENISFGNDVSVGILCWIDTNISLTPTPKLTMGNRVHIGAYSMIIAANNIEIGNNVLMSERVIILDHIHDYTDVKKAVIDQPIVSKGKIVLEDDCFIGANAVIMENIRIGKHAVVGANSVVTKDVPPFSVVAGIPAKVIKKYDSKKKQWLKV
ncbi:acyltransferase [soil metagenome]